MRLRHLCLIGFLVAASVAHAQVKQPAKAPSGPETRYFTSIDGLMDGNADVILKEQRLGKTVQSATLDVCFPVDSTSDRKDRFVATLTAANNVLTGSTQSQSDKQPVNVKLTQRPSGDGFEFKGQITIGASTVDVSSADNSDLSDKEFQDNQATDDGIVQNPKDFTEISPEAISVKVRVEAIADFLKSLRGETVEIAPSSLTISCEALRSGGAVMAMSIDPLRASAFVANVRTMPGVISAGWTGGLFDMERTIRFPAADWRDGDRISRERIAASIGAALAPAMNAKLDQTKISDTSGKIKLTFKRPSPSFPSLGLTERLEVTAMVAPDKPNSSDRLMVWVGLPTVTTIDDNSGAKLVFTDAGSNDEEGESKSDSGAIDALARQFKAQRWNSDNLTWK